MITEKQYWWKFYAYIFIKLNVFTWQFRGYVVILAKASGFSPFPCVSPVFPFLVFPMFGSLAPCLSLSLVAEPVSLHKAGLPFLLNIITWMKFSGNRLSFWCCTVHTSVIYCKSAPRNPPPSSRPLNLSHPAIPQAIKSIDFFQWVHCCWHYSPLFISPWHWYLLHG